MTEQTWGELYKGGERKSIDAGDFQMRMAAIRPLVESSLLFLDLEVINGPSAGQISQVNLFVPAPGAKGSFFFQKKVGGMLPGPPVGYAEAWEAGDTERALGILTDALDGRSFWATITVRGADAGEYAGSNELESTKPLDEAETPTPAAAATAAAPATAAPAPVASPAVATADDEIAALKAALAAAQGGEAATASATAEAERPF